jgi:hypothetical protein
LLLQKSGKLDQIILDEDILLSQFGFLQFKLFLLPLRWENKVLGICGKRFDNILTFRTLVFGLQMLFELRTSAFFFREVSLLERLNQVASVVAVLFFCCRPFVDLINYLFEI